MALGFTSLGRFVRLIVPAFLLFWLFFYFSWTKAQYDQVIRKLQSDKNRFVQDVLRHEIDGTFDGTGIDILCEGRPWIPGLILSCDAATGGVGQVRNAQLHCIRFAMEIGAELVLPEITRRDEQDIVKPKPPETGKHALRGEPLSYLFDVGHLRKSLSTSCSQMAVYESAEEVGEKHGALKPIAFKMSDLNMESDKGGVLAKPEELAKKFHAWLDTQSTPADRQYPLRVNMESITYTFPTDSDDEKITKNLGRLLRTRADLSQLAGSVLYYLTSRFNLLYDPASLSYKPSPSGAGAFVGVHLRTESDVSGNDNFPDYETQASHYLKHVAQTGARVAYLATGSDATVPGGFAHESLIAISERARQLNVTVTTKRQLFDPDDLKKLQALTWDQRALVDYEVMLRSDSLVGTGASSFAWSLALRRAKAYGGSSSQEDNAADILWRDEYSTLFVGGESVAELAEAMRLTTWP